MNISKLSFDDLLYASLCEHFRSIGVPEEYVDEKAKHLVKVANDVASQFDKKETQ
ncbi:hypothetical protein SEA_GIBBLES_6 [Gordonia phage Gibbles]|nr:hypothetical protein SEA_GIBBLES_6 [Gordonia phage Gibbles]